MPTLELVHDFRSLDEIWANIQAKCREALDTEQPILTLGHEVPNYVADVGDTWIERQSDRPVGSEASRIDKAMVGRIWQRLSTEGEVSVTTVNAPKFAFALIARCVDGVGYELSPLRLRLQPRSTGSASPLNSANGPASLASIVQSILSELNLRDAEAQFNPKKLERLVTEEGSAAVQARLGSRAKVVGRTGFGLQADVPWIAIFPAEEDASAQSGFYLAYLFAKDGAHAYLSLNQGSEHLRGGRQVLLKRALDLRTVIGDRASDALNIPLDLASNNARPRRYEAGSALAYRYRRGEFNDEQLVRDLEGLVELLMVAVEDGPRFHPEIEPMHLLFKWNAERQPTTIQDHKSIAETEGSVWWGRIAGSGVSSLSADKLADLRRQLDERFPTHAYLYRRGELWRAQVVETTSDREHILGDSRFPSYYSPTECNFFARLTDFEELPLNWAQDNLVLVSEPDPLKIQGALSNQTSPLFVFERFDPAHPPILPDAGASQPPETQHADLPAASTPMGPKVWIFQANPKFYDFVGFLRKPSTRPGTVDSWLLRQYADQVSDGDTVLFWVAGQGGGIYATGTVIGESFIRAREDWEPEDSPPSSRAIKYRLEHVLVDQPILRSDLLNHPVLKDLQILRRPQGTNFPVTEEQWDVLRPMLGPVAGIEPDPSSPPDPSIDLDWLLRETHWSANEIGEILDALRERRPQVILSGPPGTGKTWVAERIGLFLAGGRRDAVHVVQFHPSYAYEDFVEGLRPVAERGQVSFKVIPGTLVEVADQARRVDHPVVLIIDEMNRANLPSVFGELLYLLEYRDKEIRLLHRDRFSIPPNLYVIGTMNTADRSIRGLDTALRRRFDIFDCPPRPDIVESYYASPENISHILGLSSGLAKLNDLLTEHIDKHHTIGHSFLMEPDFGLADLERTWRRQIRPLIEEYFFDQPDMVDQYQVEAFWSTSEPQ